MAGGSRQDDDDDDATVIGEEPRTVESMPPRTVSLDEATSVDAPRMFGKDDDEVTALKPPKLLIPAPPSVRPTVAMDMEEISARVAQHDAAKAPVSPPKVIVSPSVGRAVPLPRNAPTHTPTGTAMRRIKKVHPMVILGAVFFALALLLAAIGLLREKPKPAAAVEGTEQDGSAKQLYEFIK